MSERYKGGVISATPPTTSQTAATGVWTMEQQMQAVAAGNWPPNGPFFIEDVFSTYLYTGNGSTQTITNNINLSGKGGLVWIKGRSNSASHTLTDTVRGAGTGPTTSKALCTDSTNGESQGGASLDYLSAFSTTGFSVVQGGSSSFLQGTNTNNVTYVSWTFREQPKFFDVVTYTGNGVAGRAISHNLGSTPGCVIVKATDLNQNWTVYHRSIGGTKALVLNLTAAADTDISYWNNSDPTSTTFIVGGNGGSTNNSGTNYVAYLFAHDAGGFGLTGSDNVISCGSFTTDGSGSATVNLGYEPQLVLAKRSSSTGGWNMLDTMRGYNMTGDDAILFANTSGAEVPTGNQYGNPTATGFVFSEYASSTYIYIAIRRGPMKTPTSSTTVFSPFLRNGTGATAVITTPNFVVDSTIIRQVTAATSGDFATLDRLRGTNNVLRTNLTNSEWTSYTDVLTSFASNTGYTLGSDASANWVNASPYSYINWAFGRAPGFFDQVCYTGTGVAHAETHNLGVTPEMMIVKKRSANDQWNVYHTLNGATKYLVLNSTAAVATLNTIWNDTAPTSTTFTVGTNGSVNTNTGTYVAYLFATVSGVSKVGSYTGTGNTLQINCGFTNGSRFVLIKRSDSTGDWYVWDSARGIVAGNDPYLLLNSTAAEVTTTDWVDTYSLGFELSNAVGNNVNINTATYIFLAIA